MEIICLQENLKKAVNIVQNIIGKNLTLPVLNNILLTAEKNQLKLISTDLEIAITCQTSSKVKKEGEITIPAKLFSNFINNTPNKKIEIKSKDSSLQITSENLKSIIKGISAKEFPLIPKTKSKPIIKIKSDKLRQALTQVINFTSLSDIRPEISGIFISFNSNNIKFTSTDSFRLGEKIITLKNNKNNKIKKSIIIPLKTAQELIRILSDQNKEELIDITIEQNQILFETSNIQIISRLIEGNYPDYEQLISKQFETNLLLDRKELINVIKINSLFSSRINDIRLKVIPKKSLLEISAENIEIGENKSEIKGEIKGKEVDVIFNYKYLLDGLNNIFNDKIILGLNSKVSPGILKPVGDSSFTYVIMPINI